MAADRTRYLIARCALPSAVACGASAVGALDVTELTWPMILVSVGGLAALARSYLMLTDPGVLDYLGDREQAGISGRFGLQIETRYGAVVLTVIGVAWVAIGLVAAL